MFASHAQIIDCSAPYDRKPRCGVYFLIDQGVVTYVGQSVDIDARIRQHVKLGKFFDSTAVHICQTSALSEIEYKYMELMLPRDNKEVVNTPQMRSDSRPVTTPDGEFAGVAQASAAAGITRQAGYMRMVRPSTGWHFTGPKPIAEKPAKVIVEKPAKVIVMKPVKQPKTPRIKEVRATKVETAYMQRFMLALPPRAVTTPSGEFASVAAAALALGISPSAVQYNLKTSAAGWRFIGPESRVLIEAEKSRFRERNTCA